MADDQTEFVLRPAEMLAKPVRLDPAFAEPERVVRLCRNSAPYKLAARVHKRAHTGKDVPWFRVMWAYGGQCVDPRAEFIFKSESFIEGAKESFGARVVVPVSLMNNINTPMASGVPHLDLPKFRGGDKLPFDLLVAMAYSGLFHDWAVPQASTISWFYDGEGGDFDFWPDGPSGERHTVSGPINNVGFVSDNEYMWHRVGPIGPVDQHMPPGTISREAELHANADGVGWQIVDGEQKWAFSNAQTRISILWKAFAFENEREYQRFLNKEHDLTVDQVVKILNKALDEKGLARLPDDCDFTDDESRRYVLKSFKPQPVNDGGLR